MLMSPMWLARSTWPLATRTERRGATAVTRDSFSTELTMCEVAPQSTNKAGKRAKGEHLSFAAGRIDLMA